MKYWSNRKYREKALALILVLVMVLTLFPGLGGSVLATETAVVEAGQVTVAYDATGADRTVDIPVNITANPGLASYTLAISYNHDALTLNNITQGTVGLGLFMGNTEPMPALVTLMGAQNDTDLGTLITLNFTVAADAAGGDYLIEVSLKDNDPGNFCNEVPQPVPVTFIPGKITVEGAPAAEPATPTFDINLSTDPIAYTSGDTATVLEVSASVSDGGTISYQWYSNSENNIEDGTAIDSETNTGYIPTTDSPGITYYYVVATNTLGTSTASAVSNVAAVTVTKAESDTAQKPIFDINLSTDPVAYTIDDTATALEVSASVSDGGVISYQWYSNSENSAEGGTELIGQTGVNYTPSTAAVGTLYYYVAATNTLESSTASATSNIAAVKVTDVNTSQTELQTLIYVCKSARGPVEISTDGKNVATNKYWVTQAAYTSFSDAIAAAEAMTASDSVDELNLAQTTLRTALNTFNSAKAPGNRSGGNSGGGTTNTSNLEYNISYNEIAGYVTVSFEDYGDRTDPKSDYSSGLGTIISPVEVPYASGDSIASVTIRLLDALGIGYSYWGTTESGFYLQRIEDFTLEDGTSVEILGEFTNGNGSGWMITWNKWFINMGASEFRVEDGDIVKWQYTCQLGADIGCDWDNPSAEITGLNFKENYGTLSPAFSEDVTDYIYTIPSSVKSICLEAKQENYWAILTYKCEGKAYKPMASIPVKNGTVIRLNCTFSEYYGATPNDTDYLTITIQVEGEKIVTPGGSPKTTLVPKVMASDGVASFVISYSNLADAITDAKENSSTAIVLTPEISGEAHKVSVELPKKAVASIASETDAALELETPVGKVTISNEALEAIASQATGSTVTMSLEAVDKSFLTLAQQDAVGDKPVYDISIMSGGKLISSINGAEITISLPYTLQEGESAGNVKVWYLNDAGELEQIDCSYDEKTGLATFKTNHLSYYLVGIEAAKGGFTMSFTDVKGSDWFYQAVKFAVENQLFAGTSETTFSPNEPMTRAMLVTVLHSLEGSPETTGANNFTDVENGQWYTKAVVWANANNIVSGYGNELFGTNDPITREQMAAILYRYADYKGYDLAAIANLSAYTDAADISNWAEKAMSWANAEGLINGRSATTLVPEGTATRAEVASILMRFVEGLMK